MVYVLLADDFEEIEAIEPVDIMRRAGIDVRTVSIMPTKGVKGAHGINILADLSLEDVNKDDMELLMLPGGAGHELLDASNGTHELINTAVIKDKYIAAICAAPSILGKKQILMDRNATCYPGYEKYCYGANMTGEKVAVDGKIITGRGPGAAAEFGFKIVEILKGADAADKLKDAMQYHD